MSEEKQIHEPSCTNFMVGDSDELGLCRCPSCSGFLPSSFPIGISKQFQCKKCGAVLETLPSSVEDPDDEEDSDMEWGGRICEVPTYAVKILTVQYPRPRKPRRRKKTDRWAMGVNFSRRVWRDKNGEFITIPERIALDDPRILKTLKLAKEHVENE